MSLEPTPVGEIRHRVQSKPIQGSVIAIILIWQYVTWLVPNGRTRCHQFITCVRDGFVNVVHAVHGNQDSKCWFEAGVCCFFRSRREAKLGLGAVSNLFRRGLWQACVRCVSCWVPWYAVDLTARSRLEWFHVGVAATCYFYCWKLVCYFSWKLFVFL